MLSAPFVDDEEEEEEEEEDEDEDDDDDVQSAKLQLCSETI